MASLFLKNPDGISKTFELTSRRTSVGRHPDNDIVLEETTASALHAEILHEGDEFILRDLHSANGCFINGTKTDRDRIKDGDIVHFAAAEARFEDETSRQEEQEEAEEDPVAKQDSFGISLVSKLKQFGEKRRERVFVHTVFFWLKDNLGPEEIEQFEKGLASLTRIKTVKQAHWGKPADTDRGVIERTYSYGLSVRFKDVAGHDSYHDDPIHQQFLDDCRPFWRRIQVFDFE